MMNYNGATQADFRVYGSRPGAGVTRVFARIPGVFSGGSAAAQAMLSFHREPERADYTAVKPHAHGLDIRSLRRFRIAASSAGQQMS